MNKTMRQTQFNMYVGIKIAASSIKIYQSVPLMIVSSSATQ